VTVLLLLLVVLMILLVNVNSPISASTDKEIYKNYTDPGSLPDTQSLVRQMLEAEEERNGTNDQ
jgi:hypothetical protein